MRILLVNRFYYPNVFGGATMVVDKLAKEFVKNGHEVLVFTAHTDSLISKTDKVYRYNHNSVEIVSVRLDNINHQTEFDNPDVEEYFTKVISSFRPDVINAHAIQGLGIGVLRAAYAMKIPVHISMHDSWFICDRQFLVNREKRYCEQKVVDLDICHFCSPNPDFLKERKALALDVLEPAASIISPSKWFSEFLRANLPISAKILTIPNGTVQPESTDVLERKGEGQLVFGYLGGIGQVKGSDVMFAALNELSEFQFKLILVNNTGSLGRKLDLSFVPSELKQKIEVRNSFTQERMDEFYNGIDCLIFPSQTMETFGLSVREALIRNKWVIASKCGGVDEAIVEGVNGNLIPIGWSHLDTWIASIRTFLRDKPINNGNPNFATSRNQAEQIMEVFSYSLKLT